MSNPAGINRRLAFEPNANLINRFWPRVDKKDPGECWPWLGAMRNNYGCIKHQGSVLSAHRVAYVLTYGEPGDKMLVGHKCDNRACCNPNHLEAITPKKNNQDARARLKFHNNEGELAPNAILTNELARAIVRLHQQHGWTGKKIAAHLGLAVHPKTISGVYRGVRWKHATADLFAATNASLSLLTSPVTQEAK